MSRFGQNAPRTNRLALAASATFVVVCACNGARSAEAFHPEGADAVSRVVLDIDAGTVNLIPGDRLQVERVVRAPDRAIDLSHFVEGEVLTIEAHCTTLLPCVVDTEVTLPDGVAVEVNLGRGEVWATGVGDLTVHLGDGDADLETLGDLAVQVGTGMVHATVAETVLVRIAVGDGDIEVQVPSVPWAIDASASRLSVQGVVTDDASSSRLDLVAPAGAVTVRGTSRVANRR